MRDYIINAELEIIKKQKPNYDDEKLEVLKYGLTGLYIFITKSFVIFSVAYFLGIFKELLIFMLIYNLIRMFSFGIHASKSHICLFASAGLFIGACYMCAYINIPSIVKLIVGPICILYMFRYSPADTEKRPIVSPKRRLTYKIISTIIAVFMVLSSLIINDIFISNSMLVALIIQCAIISPLTYKLANQQYDNYKNYHLN